MKTLLLNASPNKNEAVARALLECESTIRREGVEVLRIWIGNEQRHSCSDCGGCKSKDGCIYRDIDDITDAFTASDSVIIGVPTHFGGAPGNLLSILSRLIFSKKSCIFGKPVAVIGVGRRGCITTAIYEVEKYFKFASCPIVSGNYPAILYAKDKDSAEYDFEGLQNMRCITKNLLWLTKCIEIAKNSGVIIPPSELKIKTDIATLT